MKRREFIALLGGAAAVWPLAGRAQQADRMRRIGLLLVSGPEPLGPFREALGDLGYVDGKNIQIEVRSAQGQDTRLPELAAELVRTRVDVIIAVQTPAAHAAKNATRDIPIVVMAGDPIATGQSAILRGRAAMSLDCLPPPLRRQQRASNSLPRSNRGHAAWAFWAMPTTRS
jgi:ABC transporter substrate binding protein